MASVFVRTRKDAEKVETLMVNAHGFLPTIFRDGNGYVVQHNDIGQDALIKILRDGGMDALADDLQR